MTRLSARLRPFGSSGSSLSLLSLTVAIAVQPEACGQKPDAHGDFCRSRGRSPHESQNDAAGTESAAEGQEVLVSQELRCLHCRRETIRSEIRAGRFAMPSRLRYRWPRSLGWIGTGIGLLLRLIFAASHAGNGYSLPNRRVVRHRTVTVSVVAQRRAGNIPRQSPASPREAASTCSRRCENRRSHLRLGKRKPVELSVTEIRIGIAVGKLEARQPAWQVRRQLSNLRKVKDKFGQSA